MPWEGRLLLGVNQSYGFGAVRCYGDGFEGH